MLLIIVDFLYITKLSVLMLLTSIKQFCALYPGSLYENLVPKKNTVSVLYF